MCAGRDEEGTSSNRPELGGVLLALQSAALSEDVLLLCDNEAVLCAIKKWVGQGGKATLATVPDADILREIVCLPTQRVRAGRATFLIKVKSHRGEPINERADTLAERTQCLPKTRAGLSCRRPEQQQQSTGQNACGIVTTNAGCRRRGQEQRHPRVEVSKMNRTGARNALKI
jgi:ribonuclease HI